MLAGFILGIIAVLIVTCIVIDVKEERAKADKAATMKLQLCDMVRNYKYNYGSITLPECGVEGDATYIKTQCRMTTDDVLGWCK